MNKIETYIKRQIRVAIANHEGIENLNDVSIEKINQAYESKELNNYRIKQDIMQSGKTYFAFVDKATGYFYNSIIL